MSDGVRESKLGRDHHEVDVGEIATEVAALLRAGADPKDAWAHALSQQPSGSPWANAGAQIAAGYEVDHALNQLAGEVKFPGPLLGAVAGLRLATEIGSSAADVLDECVQTVSELQASANERHASLAGPRSTMRILLALPLFALFLFAGAGVNGLGVLLGTPAGWFCAAVGAALLYAGHRWVRRLVRAAERGEGEA